MTMDERLRVVIADDEPRARQFLEKLLSEHEHVEVAGVAKGGGEALALIAKTKPDAAFLDIHMPDLSGLEVARHLKGDDAPIVVFVTAYDEHAVHAFEIQAFDYLLKPFDDERVIGTVKRAGEFLDWIRREGEGDAALNGFGDVSVDFATHQVRRAGRVAELRPKEYALLVALLKRGGRVASRLELLREVWGYAEDVMSRTVDTHVAMLRRKLERDPAHPRHIVTVRTFGYRIER